MTTSAVILAAGAGTRLGGVAKALLVDRSQQTFLTNIVMTLREVGVRDVIVVVGPPFGDAVADHACALDARVAVNPRPERGMASSVALGFSVLDASPGDDAAEVNAAWLWPVDHPHVQPSTLRRLSSALMQHDAVRPTYAGRGGHPPLVARSLFGRLAGCAGIEGGARAVLAAADTVDVEVDDPGVVRDVDTAIDLEAV